MNLKPDSKITDAAIGGALATLVVGLLQANTTVVFPPGTEGALAVITAVAVGYLLPERRNKT